MTYEELTALYAEEEKKLKQKMEQLRAKKRRIETVQQAKKRKLENHGKFLFAGWMLAELKKSGDARQLEKCKESLKKEADKKAIDALIELVKTRPSGGVRA